MKNTSKIKLFERFIKENCILWYDNGVYNKWDDCVNLVEEYPKEFQNYIKKLVKEKK